MSDDHDTPSFRPPRINGWAPWIGLLVAIAVPTLTLVMQLGATRERVDQAVARSEENSRRLESVARDVAVLRVTLVERSNGQWKIRSVHPDPDGEQSGGDR